MCHALQPWQSAASRSPRCPHSSNRVPPDLLGLPDAPNHRPRAKIQIDRTIIFVAPNGSPEWALPESQQMTTTELRAM
jgi:hypothetical protein